MVQPKDAPRSTAGPVLPTPAALAAARLLLRKQAEKTAKSRTARKAKRDAARLLLLSHGTEEEKAKAALAIASAEAQKAS